MNERRPRVAVTMGDPRGIGPEIVAKVLADPPEPAEYTVIGPEVLMGDLEGVRKIAVGPRGVAASGSGSSLAGIDAELAGRYAVAAVETAVELALAGEVDAVVTAPAEKRALHLAGCRYPGHTEWLAALAGGAEVAMMLASERLRVVLATTHLPLRQALDCLTAEQVVRVGRIARDALRAWWGITNPRLAVCAVNPHAGEGGLFGDEDQRLLVPAARELGAAGPLPADTVFVRAIRGEFDAVIAPYHDVGMTAIKVASFGKAVNVTLGLPFIRTAPDHGTAFDIAGRGIADPGSMREAVLLAARLARVSAAAAVNR
ncbi:MAG: 4-hydroxythreonine-4-phosphate dehydrogenase 2 [Gemmatimonadales bacterium]|nr:MAG: 4-hydroxythreonine-4-phosphate dehydrogenase 2 [Gemmatimonadales bacterium]